TFYNNCPMGGHLQADHACFALMDRLYQTVSEISCHRKLFAFAGSGSGDSQLPCGTLYYLGLITVIDGHHSLFFICTSPVAELLIIIGQKLYRSSQQLIIFFMNPDNIPMEIDQFLILSAPRVSPSVVRVCKSAESRLISIVDGGCSRPGHLNHYRFP